METESFIQMIVMVVGGLGMFLLGMKQMSEGMQVIAGEKMRKLISKVTDNNLVGVGVGAALTGLIQSSSVTTVMVVGMVNAGVMTLRQSIGVILGADIGTTVTAWIIALKIADYGLPILGISAFFYLFSKNERIRYIAVMFLGLGMVFYGLELMKGGFEPLRDDPAFLSLFSRFQPSNHIGVLKCVLVGAFVTAIIQSSSATVAITIALAKTGAIGYDTAVALVLGENIGTTITAYLASLGATTNAKRTAYAHILIKIMAVCLMIPIFYSYLWILKTILSENIPLPARIAFAHTVFNIFVVCLFLPLVAPLSSFLLRFVPEKSYKEIPHLTYLDIRMLDAPALGIKQSFDEILRMNGDVLKMFKWREILLSENNGKNERKIFQTEEKFDVIQKEITEFLSKLLAGNLSMHETKEIRKQLRMADEYESISDCVVIIMKLFLKMQKNGLNIIEQDRNNISDLHKSVSGYVEWIGQAIQNKNTGILVKVLAEGKVINNKVKNYRSLHINELGATPNSPLASLIYTDILNAYRRIKDHSLNIAEALCLE
ncbi:Na/Pi cotransporter family protein [candidate division KSB1 bacterium]|nr:Na/Pi cotransporter family protein [candidate division KSB1 bacterium]